MKTHDLTTCSLLRVLFAGAGTLVLSIGAARAADYPTTILNDNPSAYYRLEETSGSIAYDSSTNQVNAAITQNGEDTSPVLGAAGIDTNSFNFIVPGPGGEGDYGYVTIPESPLITPVDGTGTNSLPFSAELWVQPNGYPTTWSVPILQGVNNGVVADGWNIYVSGPGAGNPAGQSYFYLDMRPGIFIGYGDFLISFGQWYHLVLTFDGTTNGVFYINGVAHSFSVPPGGFAPDTTENAFIASGSSIGWDPFNGGVDEVAFYDHVLTQTQVSTHYTVGSSSFRVIPTAAGITTPPSPETQYSGVPVTFNVTASGTTPLTYIWSTNGIPTGTDSDFLTFTPTYPGDNNDHIQVIVSNAYGPPVTSSVVTLTVSTNLNIIAEPASITRNVGSHAAFHVTADGALPITYQWSVSSDGGSTFTPILSATNQTGTNQTLWLSNVQLSQSGNIYSVLVGNPFINSSQSNSSQSATLTVQPRQDPPVSLSGYGAIIAADNPVAFWRLNETSTNWSGGVVAEDAVGSFDGIITPGSQPIGFGAPSGVPYDTNTAITLAGGATIQIPWAPELNPDTAWSVETWVNPSSLSANGGDYRLVLSSQYNDQAAGYPYNGWYIYQQPANDFAFVPQPGNGFITAGPIDPAHGNQLVAGNWYHLVVTDDTTNFNIYVNGTLITAYPVSAVQYIPNGDGINPDGNPGIPTGPDFGDDQGNFVIGQRDDAAFGTFLGTVEDTAVYQYALSPQQVALHHLDATMLTITPAGSNVILTWPVGNLQQSTRASGIYTDVIGATSPYTNAVGGTANYYRVQVP
jgi:hypothetical protein